MVADARTLSGVHLRAGMASTSYPCTCAVTFDVCPWPGGFVHGLDSRPRFYEAADAQEGNANEGA